MLASLSMTDAKYELWRNGFPYARRRLGNLDYDEFSEAHLMALFLIGYVLFLFPFSFLFSLYLLYVMILNVLIISGCY